MSARIITHSGNFHADEVFAVASLTLLLGDIDVLRTRDDKVIESAGADDYVIDVGAKYEPEKKRFDHHQEGGAGTRKNGVPYASFGLVWREYGEKICGSRKAAEKIDEKLAQPIDLGDNGLEVCKPVVDGVLEYPIWRVIDLWRPTWKEEGGQDGSFKEAVKFAKWVLEREIKRTLDGLESDKIVEQVYKNSEDKRIMVFERQMPFKDFLLKYKEPLFVISPDPQNGGNWRITAMYSDNRSFSRRKYFPENWAGKRNSEFAETSGVPDAVFCHNHRFIAVAKSKEGALALAMLATES